MVIQRVTPLVLLLLLMEGSELAGQGRTATSGASRPPADLRDLDWLAGHWEGEGLGGHSFETISPPVAGQMSGHFQQVKNGAVRFYEFYQFVPHNGSIVLRIKHFDPDLKGWEERHETENFPLLAIDNGTLYFDGLTMKRLGRDGLRTIVRTSRSGKEQNIVFTFRRARFR